MKTEKVDSNDWRFKDKVEKIIESNITKIPWEGDEIDKRGIVEDIIELLTSKDYSLLHHIKT